MTMDDKDLAFLQERANETGMVMGLLKVFVMIDTKHPKVGHDVLEDISANAVEFASSCPAGMVLAAETEYLAIAPAKVEPQPATQASDGEQS